MSFLNILGKIWHGVEVAAPVAMPIITSVNPVAGGILQLVMGGVVQAEHMYTESQAGAQKKQFVVDSVNAALPLIQMGFQMAGKTLNIDQAGLSQLIDDLVKVLNTTAAVTTPK